MKRNTITRERLANEAIETITMMGYNGVGFIRLAEILKELGLNIKDPMYKFAAELKTIAERKELENEETKLG